MLDLQPAAEQLGAVVEGIADEQLDAPTPCEKYQVSGLVEHVIGLTEAFRLAAVKDPDASKNPPGTDPPATAQLPAGWRQRIRRQLDALVGAWREPGAWEGDTEAGGVHLPAPVMATVALQELVVHGWDLARATGQEFDVDDTHAETLHQVLDESVSEEGVPGLFGPPVPVPDEAPLLARVIGLTGRDPAWRP